MIFLQAFSEEKNMHPNIASFSRNVSINDKTTLCPNIYTHETAKNSKILYFVSLYHLGQLPWKENLVTVYALSHQSPMYLKGHSRVIVNSWVFLHQQSMINNTQPTHRHTSLLYTYLMTRQHSSETCSYFRAVSDAVKNLHVLSSGSFCIQPHLCSQLSGICRLLPLHPSIWWPGTLTWAVGLRSSLT